MPEINTNGLLAVSTNNTTWVAPSANFPVTLSNQQRGGVMVITGAAGDQLLDINGRLLQDGQIVFNQAAYTEAPGIDRAANTYFRYLSGAARQADGTVTNVSTDWTPLNTGGGGGDAVFIPLANIAALNTQATVPPVNNQAFTVLDPTLAAAAPGAGGPNPAIADLPTPVGGWSAALNLNVQWRTATADWIALGFSVDDPDTRYVNQTGDTMTGPLRFNDATGETITLNNTGAAIFNERGQDVDFRVEGVNEPDALFVDGANGNVGIHLNNPTTPLHVNGQSTFVGEVNINTGSNINISNAANTRTVSINADDAADNYTVTLPPTQPGADGQVLTVDTGGGTNNAELSWAAVTVPLEAWTAITNAWDLDNDLLVFINTANQTVPIPTNQRSGQTGMLRLDQAATWPAAGGAVFQYAGGAIPNITQFPAIIPYTVITTGTNADLSNGVILWGAPTVNIT